MIKYQATGLRKDPSDMKQRKERNSREAKAILWDLAPPSLDLT